MTDKGAVDLDKYYEDFYEALFAPVAAAYGALDPGHMGAIAGFEFGGPVALCTIGRNAAAAQVTYVTCELAVRDDQVPSKSGRYEILITCDDQRWARAVLTKIGRMTLESEFGHLDTLDISPCVGEGATIQGILIEVFSETRFEDTNYGTLRLHGLTREELESALASGPEAMLRKKASDSLPLTTVGSYHLTEN